MEKTALPARPRIDPFGGSGSTRRSRVLALHPGSGGGQKNWPVELFRALVGKLRCPVVVLLGPAELPEMGEALVEIGAHVRLSGVLSVPELARVLAEVSIYVGNDSGPTHLAAAVGTPTVSIFCATDPDCWAPRGPHVRVVGGKDGPPGVEEVFRTVESLRFQSTAE